MKELPPKVRKRLLQLEGLYGVTQVELEAVILAWSVEDVAEVLVPINQSIDRLDRQTAVIVRDVVHRIVTFETALAERRLGAPAVTISQDAMDAIDRRFYSVFVQQNAETRERIEDVITSGFKRGMSLEDRRAFQRSVIKEGVTGLVRADGSKLSVKATGKAMVRTRVNQLQAETQLSRYRQADVEEVEFLAGGACRFKGQGGTCTSLNGRKFPIDAIPSWAQIPRHLYSNSRWLPVTK